ncbi:UNKNOWN [Stylonychia lemnae]|uniref:Uncharacterized protein n=1 Tax=Stylonychia lemnae TaxID=5949 RepID=A0A078AW73_STYLE|nr:UNKNOWN [Stylonychia lemnae]|eukprot:CDW86384.1 UNKNOWN [Stylonychia lemnae]
MFKRFFSCFNDSSDQRQVDLSRNTLQNQQYYIAQVNPESNIIGEQINFETHDFDSSRFQKHLNQNAPLHMIGVLNKVIYSQLFLIFTFFIQFYNESSQHDIDQYGAGFEETKITTASPSKNHLHKLQLEEMNPDLVPVLHQGSLMSRNHIENSSNDLFHQGNNDTLQNLESQSFVENQQLHEQSQLTVLNQINVEKQLNSYLQQANHLANLNTAGQDRHDSQKRQNLGNHYYQQERSSTDKEYSSSSFKTIGPQTQNQLMNPQQQSQKSSTYRQSQDSSETSSKVMFNAAHYNSTNVQDHQLTTINPDLIGQSKQPEYKTPQQSFYKTHRGGHHKRTPTGALTLKKDKLLIKGNSHQKNSRTSQNNDGNIVTPYRTYRIPQSVRASLVSKSDSLKSSSQKSTPLKRGQRASPQQMIDQLDQVILEEQNQDLDQTLEEIKVVEVGEDDFVDQQLLDVFDPEDGYQMDLGALQSIKKRQTSKTEVFNPSFNSPLKKQMVNHQPRIQPLFSSNINAAGIQQQVRQIQFSHKKTISQTPLMHLAQTTGSMYGSTRNSGLQQKISQKSNSPIRDRASSAQKKRQSHGAVLLQPQKQTVNKIQNPRKSSGLNFSNGNINNSNQKETSNKRLSLQMSACSNDEEERVTKEHKDQRMTEYFKIQNQGLYQQIKHQQHSYQNKYASTSQSAKQI